MAVRTRAREAETALPKVVEQKADYQRSVDVARKHNGTIIRLERLPQLLNDPEFVKSIESTESYKRKGYTWFWTDTEGTNLNGYYRINPQGKTLDEIFTLISDRFDRKIENVPFNERSYFYKGNQHLSVDVGGLDGVGRLYVSGNGRLGDVAPVVVVEQVQSMATAQPSSGIARGTESTAASNKTRYKNSGTAQQLTQATSNIIESELNEFLESRCVSPEKRDRIISVLRGE